MYYLNFAPECTLTTTDPMPDAEIESKLSQLTNLVDEAKERHTAATAALKKAATTGAKAIASATETVETTAAELSAELEASKGGVPLPMETAKHASPRKDAGALKSLGEAEQTAKTNWTDAIRRLKKAKGEYEASNATLAKKATTIK